MILKYLDKLQENVEDKLLPKPDGKFSNQEKTLIDNFIFSILKKDKDSKISYTNTKIYDDRSGVSEEITKSINLWEEDVRFTFHKICFSKKSIVKIIKSYNKKFPKDKISIGAI